MTLFTTVGRKAATAGTGTSCSHEDDGTHSLPLWLHIIYIVKQQPEPRSYLGQLSPWKRFGPRRSHARFTQLISCRPVLQISNVLRIHVGKSSNNACLQQENSLSCLPVRPASPWDDIRDLIKSKDKIRMWPFPSSALTKLVTANEHMDHNRAGTRFATPSLWS